MSSLTGYPEATGYSTVSTPYQNDSDGKQIKGPLKGLFLCRDCGKNIDEKTFEAITNIYCGSAFRHLLTTGV